MKSYISKILMLVLVFGILPYNGACTQAQSDSEKDAQKKDKVYTMYKDYKKDFPDVKDISPKQAMLLMKKKTGNKKLVFVDTRKSKEMKVSMLPGSITQDAFLNNLEKYKEHTVTAYCTISYRSGKLAEKLANKGINIYNLTGGILAWIHEGGKVFDKNGETKRVHVYGKKWNLAPGDYESLW